VRGPHLADVLPPRELMRKRLDPGRANSLQLVAPIAKNV